MSCRFATRTSPIGRSESPTWLPTIVLSSRSWICRQWRTTHAEFPLYTDSPRGSAERPGRRSLAIGISPGALTGLGFEYGYSRLAVGRLPQNGDAGCVDCGLCLYGCPYSLIYSSAHSLPELESFPGFRYVPGHYVERVEEKQGLVTIHGRAPTPAAERNLTRSGSSWAVGRYRRPRLSSSRSTSRDARAFSMTVNIS